MQTPGAGGHTQHAKRLIAFHKGEDGFWVLSRLSQVLANP